MFIDLQLQILQDVVETCGLLRLDRSMNEQCYVYIPREDQKTRNAWTYYRDGGHRKAKRTADFKHQTPEQRAHENNLRNIRTRARRALMTPAERAIDRGKKPKSLTTATS